MQSVHACGVAVNIVQQDYSVQLTAGRSCSVAWQLQPPYMLYSEEENLPERLCRFVIPGGRV